MIVNPENVPAELAAIKFGVEIEMIGAGSRSNLAFSIAALLNTTADLQDNGSYSITDADGDVWKIKSDGSVYTTQPGDRTGHELVTPPITYAKLGMLEEILVRARALGFTTNETCGGHVHVDMRGTNARQIANLVRLFCDVQNDLFAKIADRAPQRYAKKLQANALRRGLETFENENGDLTLLGANRIASAYGRGTSVLGSGWRDRYRALNVVHAFARHGTCEFRLFNGTMEFEKIRSRVLVVLAMRHIACTQTYSKTTLSRLLVVAGFAPNADTALAFIATEAIAIATPRAPRTRRTTAALNPATTNDAAILAGVRAYRAGDRSPETMTAVRAYRASLAARRAS